MTVPKTDPDDPGPQDPRDEEAPPQKWGHPESIPNIPIKPLPRLPGVIGDMIDAVAEAFQVPGDLPFMIVLGILAMCVGGRRRLRVAPDWTEVLALYTAALVPSGERKSPVVAVLAAPLYEVERELVERVTPLVARQKDLRDVHQAKVDKLKKKADTTAGALLALDTARDRRDAVDVPTIPQLTCDDATPEALTRAVAQQGGRMGVLSTEAGLFDTLAGRYSNGTPNLDLILKAWSGDRCRVDRIGRDPDIIPEPVMSIALAFQPAVLAGLAETRRFRGAGLLARWLYAIPRSRVGTRDTRPRAVPPGVQQRYNDAIRALAGLWSSESIDEMKLAPDAADVLDDLRNDLERRMSPEGGDLGEAGADMGDWANKIAGQLVRVAGLFTLVDDPYAGAVDEQMSVAVGLADYFIDHAKRAFDLMHGRRSPTEPPRALLRWITNKRIETFTQRDAWQALRGQAWAETSDDVGAAIVDLEERGWVRKLPLEKGPGRPSQRYETHPTVRSDDTPPPASDPPPPTVDDDGYHRGSV